MNYEKAYKDALETARKINSGEGVAAPPDWTTYEVIFPELKDVDERIRNVIRGWICTRPTSFFDNGISKEEMIAWLEKQGNPADKIEPKFKNGQWIVFNGLTLYVKEVVKGFYRTITIDGIPNSYDWDIDNIARLWTIADTKDGDVLVSDNSIFIFQEEYIAEKPTAYCGLMNGLFIEGNGTCWTNEKCYPANKEQRDLLFSKMKESGYEWDADKKELKKIERKPAWSDEDEAGFGDTLWAIEQARTIVKDENDIGNLWYAERWLKSIKKRMEEQ